ncbi:CshA/CshB family fibrillar adhesin-related protein [Lysobacter sp. Root604]|uniref:CshA/CshB family fibrillar adhesin-related protein n=1 Tax=Lysobacter sp. Root604 TaxID=1736568 RepID=UPI0009E88F66|nr:CshA/CshB family fibrillar adhesin-related protein [Lysobacter sp. Root604]
MFDQGCWSFVLESRLAAAVDACWRGVARPPLGAAHAGAMAGNKLHAHRPAIAALWLLAAIAFLPSPAKAQFATGGAGVYRNQIVWFSWGIDGGAIPQAGGSVTNSTAIGGQFLRTTCTISAIGGNKADPDLIAYRPGNWTGDIFDDMYFTGLGAGTLNTLVVGLANRTNGGGPSGVTTVNGLVSCSATFGPTNSAADPAYPLGGLVIADAEQSSGAQGENISMQGTPGTTWRLIERASTCGEFGATTTHVPASSLLAFNGAAGSGCSGVGAAGPAGIAFLDGGTVVSFAMVGGGRSALALGVMVYVADLGDAPVSYGQALHLPRFQFTGGVPTAGVAGLFSYPLAQFNFPSLRLGPFVDTELVNQSNAGATGDDIALLDDEDSVIPPASITLVPGSSYTLNNVQCAGTGTVYGYIDFNRDGDFADSDERSAAATCPGTGPIAVTWTMPAASGLSRGASYLRLRIASSATEAGAPTGNAVDGEVEDYAIALAEVADLSVTKTNTPGLNNEVDQASDTLQSGTATTYTLRATNSGPSTITGAVVRDTPGAGITCPAGNTVTISGDGVPLGGPFTVANLTAGISLGALAAGQTAVLSFTCNVQ